MFGHLLKLAWKRKGRHAMLSVEIMLAFIIVFAVAAGAVRLRQLYQTPLGYQHQDVWTVRMIAPTEVAGTFTEAVYDQFRRSLAAMPQVQSVAFANTSPFRHSGMRSDMRSEIDGRALRTDVLEVSDDFFSILGMHTVSGRFFDQRDLARDPQPVVVNRRFAHAMFGTDAVIGKRFDASERDSKAPEMMMITGVVDEFRKTGELEASRPVAITRPSTQDSGHMQIILLKMIPGTPRAFEEQLNRRLTSIRNDWTYEVEPLAAARTSAMADVLAPLMMGAVIAAFLLAMVAVGLFGVLWQNTTRRIPEMGLRRAVGASRGDIYRQIIGEQLLLSSGAILAGLLLMLQLPITGVLGESLNWGVFAGAAALATAAIYLLSLLCALHPGWRASRLSPTQALHCE
jgi:putative ABC transport system permease protein